MLIKEYRIPLPLTVEEYRIAQLYMIAVSEILSIQILITQLNLLENIAEEEQRRELW